MKNLEKGKRGEQLALDFLISRGYQILKRNYRYNNAEVDIILKKREYIIFVEVKYRTSAAFGFPEEFLHTGQMNRIKAAAENFLFEMQSEYYHRFDIISILSKRGRKEEILHIKDAFY